MKHLHYFYFALLAACPERGRLWRCRASALLLTALALGAVLGPLALPALGAQSILPTLAPTTRSAAPSRTPSPAGTAPGAGLLVSAAVATLTPTPAGWSPSIDELVRLMEAAWSAQNWPEVLHLIDLIAAINPNYGNIQERRYFAYVNYGYQLMTEARCGDARWAFQQALVVRPGGEEANMGLNLLARYCSSPTAGPSPTQTAVVRTATPCPTTTALPGTAIIYVVQPGDTLFALAQRYATTVQAIMTANGLATAQIISGQTLTIPAGSAAPSSPLVHIVKPGETLTSIARTYGTTVTAMDVSVTIYAYQSLFIPTGSAQPQTVHIVQRGETLYTIAQRYSTTVALIMLANNLRDYSIYEYQPLVIPPVGWTGWPPLETSAPYRTHLVMPGDTLWGIARRYGVTVGALMTANGLSSSAIYAGDTLRIP